MHQNSFARMLEPILLKGLPAIYFYDVSKLEYLVFRFFLGPAVYIHHVQTSGRFFDCRRHISSCIRTHSTPPTS